MIYASLGLDWSQYAKGLSDAAKGTQTAFGNITKALAGGDIKGTIAAMGSALAAIPAPLVAAAAGAGLVAVAAKGMWDAMGKAKEMNVMAEQAGMTATQFSVLSKVFGKIGVDAEQIPSVMSKMAASMAEISDPGSKAAQALARIGINAAMLDGKSQYEQFKLIAAGINQLESSSSKMQVARTIFGRSGASFLPAMKPEAIAKAETRISPMAKIAEESGGAFLDFQAAVKGLKVDIGGFFAGMASTAVPALQSVVEQLGYIVRYMNNVLAEVGKTMGSGIAFWVTSLKEGLTGMASAISAIFGGLVLFVMNTINSAIALIYEAADAIKQRFGFGKSVTIAPILDTTSVEDAIGSLMEKTNKRIQQESEQAAAKKTPPPGGLELTQKGLPSMPQAITSGASKVGALGGAVWGADVALNLQREQLSVQQRIANSIDAFLKTASPASNPMLGDLTPAFGVI